MTQRGDHVDFLDHVRGAAIVMVFAFHALLVAFGRDALPYVDGVRSFDVGSAFLAVAGATLGREGVAVFFVVSGFCIHLSHRHSSDKGWDLFFLRRFFRIYPPYLAALVLFGLIFPYSRLWLEDPLYAPQLASHLVMAHNFDVRTMFGINSSFWSLAVEVQLYLLYPALLGLVRRVGWRGTLGLLLLVEVAVTTGRTTGAPALPAWTHFSPLAYWFSWSIGARLAEAWADRGAGSAARLPFARLPFLLTLPAYGAAFTYLPLAGQQFTVASLMTAQLMARLLEGRRLRIPVPAFVWSHLRQAGVWSFSIYLIHQPLLWQVPVLLKWAKVPATLPPLAVYGACLLSWIPIAWLGSVCYNSVEMWSIAAGKRLLRPTPPAVAVPALERAPRRAA